MGLSGILLKPKNDIQFDMILCQMKQIIHSLNLICHDDIENSRNERGEYQYTAISVMDNSQRGFLMYVYNQSDDIFDTEFDWIQPGRKLNQIVNIENFHDCEDILLDLVYEYLKRNPNDIFYDECDWFYTYEAIKRIKQKKFDPDWCYQSPSIDVNQ